VRPLADERSPSKKGETRSGKRDRLGFDTER